MNNFIPSPNPTAIQYQITDHNEYKFYEFNLIEFLIHLYQQYINNAQS